MTVATHVARVGIFNVDSSGSRIDKNTASISQTLATRQEALVIYDSNLPNTVGYPTIKSYLELEAVDGYQLISMDNSFIVTADPTAVNSKQAADAFGRHRTAEPYTIGDYKNLYAADANFITKVSNGGSATHNPNKSSVTLATSTNTSSLAIYQSKLYHQYQPGKSQLIYLSFVLGSPTTNTTKRVGYFDDRDGIYFEQVGTGVLNWVIRNYATGTAIENRVPQSGWNIDKCDGTGPSGFNLNVTKTQLIFTDFQWLGVGRVRCGFVHNGELIIAHEFEHSNNLSTVYMSNPNLPVRSEIRNTGATTGGSFEHICSSVQSEGGYKEVGIDWEISNTALRTTATPGGTPLPVIAIRLKNTFNSAPNRMSVILTNIGLYVETKPIKFTLVKLPNESSLTGTVTWVSADVDSGCEYTVTPTGFTAANADNLFGGFSSAGTSQNSRSEVGVGGLTDSRRNFISQNVDSNNSEVYAVIVRTIATGGADVASVICSLQWREIY